MVIRQVWLSAASASGVREQVRIAHLAGQAFGPCPALLRLLVPAADDARLTISTEWSPHPPGEGFDQDVALASLIGTTIEWYDFFLYGTAAALVFNRLYFPTFDPLAGTLAAFGTYTVGFVARPIGGIVIGHYGDRIGRKSMLILTLIIMGVATFGIGLLPTYAQIGPWAARRAGGAALAQGFGVGGEWGGAVLMAVEHAPPGSRGFYGSWPQVGVPAGLLLSTAVFAQFARLPEEQFLTWGWRVPFLLSILLVGVGLIIRVRILETPAFARVKEARTEARRPIVEVLRTHPKEVLLAMGARFAENGGVLHLHRVRPRLWDAASRDRSADRAERHPDRGGVRAGRDPRCAARCPIGWDGGRSICSAPASPGCSRIRCSGCSTPDRRRWCGSRSSWRSSSRTRRCTGRRRRSCPSCSARGSVTAARRWDPSSRRSIAGGLSPFIATALLPYGRGALASYIIAMALVTIVAVLLARNPASDHRLNRWTSVRMLHLMATRQESAVAQAPLKVLVDAISRQVPTATPAWPVALSVAAKRHGAVNSAKRA